MTIVAVLVLLLAASTLAQEELWNPICNHWLDPGECNEFSVKWYYDRYDHRCRRFHYSGCGGNPNRFNTLEECSSSCTYTPPTAADRCSLPHEPGHCNADIERWFFDWNKKQCVCSYWTGCGGNSNIYYTYNHCLEICGDYAAPGIGPGIDENYWGVLNKSTMTLENMEVFANHASNPNHPANYYLKRQWHPVPIVINGPPAEPPESHSYSPQQQGTHQKTHLQPPQQYLAPSEKQYTAQHKAHPSQPAAGQPQYPSQPIQHQSTAQVKSHPAQPASHPQHPAQPYASHHAQQDPEDEEWDPQWNNQYQEWSASETQSRAHGAKTVTVDNEIQLPSRNWSKKYRKQKIPPRRISPTTPSPNSPPSIFSYTYYTDERGNQIPVPRHIYIQQRVQPTQFYATYKTDRMGREIWSQKIWWTGGGPMPVHALRRRYPQWLPPPYDGFGRNPYEDSITPTSPYRKQPVNRWPAVPVATPAPKRRPYVTPPTLPLATSASVTIEPSRLQTWTVRPTVPPAPTTPYVRPTRPIATAPAYVPRQDPITPAPQPKEYQRYLGPEVQTITTPMPEITTTTTLPPTTIPTTVFVPTRPPTTTSSTTTTTTTTTTSTTTRPPQTVTVRPQVEDMTTRVITTTPRPTWRAAAEPMQYQRWLVQTVTTEKPLSIDDIIALDEESYDQYDMEMEPDTPEDRVVPTQLPPTPALPRTTPRSPLPRATAAPPARKGWQPIVMPPPSHDNSQGSDYADNVDFDIRPIPES